MIAVPDNAHCLKHACSHPLDRECPKCLVSRLVKSLMRERYPYANRVTFPVLMAELDNLDQELREQS